MEIYDMLDRQPPNPPAWWVQRHAEVSAFFATPEMQERVYQDEQQFLVRLGLLPTHELSAGPRIMN